LERPRWQRYPLDWSHALELNSPNDRTVAVDSAGAARTIKTIEREELANYEAPGPVGIEAFRSCRPECQQNNDYNRAAYNHMIRPPADHQGTVFAEHEPARDNILNEGLIGVRPSYAAIERRLRHRSMQSAYFLIRSKIRLTVLMRLAEDESMRYTPSQGHPIRRHG